MKRIGFGVEARRAVRSVLFGMACAAAASAFGEVRALTPQTPSSAWTKPWWMPRHEEKMKEIREKDPQVLFVGDSITHYFETQWRGRVVWQKYFAGAPYNAVDLGFSADRTEHVLWRLTTGGELDGCRPKCIVLMIGTNNSGHFPIEQEPPVDTILGVRRILQVMRAKQPQAKIVLCAIFPRGADVNDGYRHRNNVVNKEIAKLADGKDVFWCDFTEQFLTADGRLPRELFPDLLHPLANGYEIWANAVKPYIDYALSDGKFLPPANRYASCVRAEEYRMDPVREPDFPTSRIRIEDHSDFDWWLDRLERNRNRIADAKGEFDLVFAGDSITHNWERPGAAVFAQVTNRYSVLNIGYSGDCIQHLRWRIEYGGELDGYKAKGIMLLIGVNNAGAEAPVVADGVKRILELIDLKQPQAKVLLLGIFPRGTSEGDVHRQKNRAVNKILATYADNEKVFFLDFGDQFLKNGDTTWCMPDNVHPNAWAYEHIWLPAVAPYFSRFVGK